MKKAIVTCFSYVAMAGLGALTAFLLVQQFVPRAQSQDQIEELDSGFEPPADMELEELEEMEPPTEEELESDDFDGAVEQEPFTSSNAIDLLIDEGYNYLPSGKRNPFRPYIETGQTTSAQVIDLSPLQRYDLPLLKLVGVLWDVENPKAMILAPDGVHVVGKNEKLGRNNGYIAVIREGEIVVVESFEEGGEVKYNTRVLSIAE